MNIAIAGARGVGKTSLFRSLKIELPKEYKIYLFGDTVFGKAGNTKTILEYMKNQEEVVLQYIAAQKWSENCGFSIMSDGSIIDAMAHMIIGNHTYFGFIFPGDLKKNIKMLHYLSPSVDEAISRFTTYDLIFYLPTEFECKGVSIEETVRQKKVDAVIKELMDMYNVRYHTVRGSVDDRKSVALEAIKQHVEGK